MAPIGNMKLNDLPYEHNIDYLLSIKNPIKCHCLIKFDKIIDFEQASFGRVYDNVMQYIIIILINISIF